MIDTHCHLNLDAFDADRQNVIDQALAAGVTRIINPAIDLETSADILALSETSLMIFAAVGVHPNSTADWQPSYIEAIREHAKHGRVVAIGEIGLDYHWDTSPRTTQIRAFEAQLELARSLALPVIIHNREAEADVVPMLESWAAALPAEQRERPGVLHSFSGSVNAAERMLAAGFYLGFTGPITYKNADTTRHIAGLTPLNRLLVETDAPYLTPVPHRGKRNEPAYIPLIVDRLASIKRLSADEMGTLTEVNAMTLFSIQGVEKRP